jgi:hypothetical protein
LPTIRKSFCNQKTTKLESAVGGNIGRKSRIRNYECILMDLTVLHARAACAVELKLPFGENLVMVLRSSVVEG